MSPRDAATIVDETALGAAQANFTETARAWPADYSRYQESRDAFLEAARRLRNRNDRLAQRLGELNGLEAEADLPRTELPEGIGGGPEPVTAEDYAAEPHW
jgi:hypothetical protein